MPVPKSDLRTETMRGQGPGGQYRNKTDSAVRITHLPCPDQRAREDWNEREAEKKRRHHTRHPQRLKRRPPNWFLWLFAVAVLLAIILTVVLLSRKNSEATNEKRQGLTTATSYCSAGGASVGGVSSVA